MAEGLTVSIVSSNGLIREGLTRILEAHGIGLASSVARIDEITEPGAAILLDMTANLDVGQSVAELRDRFESSRVIVIGDGGAAVANNVIKAGADQFIFRTIHPEAFDVLVRMAVAELCISDLIEHVLDRSSRHHSPETARAEILKSLTAREYEVLQQLVEGMSDQEISSNLEIARDTVRVHIRSMTRKLGVRNRTQAAIWGIQRGLTPANAT